MIMIYHSGTVEALGTHNRKFVDREENNGGDDYYHRVMKNLVNMVI